MSFLSCIPTVFVIGAEYEILINLKDNGICSIEVGGKRYYEENSGVLFSEKYYAKIRVPQNELDRYKKYTVCYRKTVERKSYFSVFEDEISAEFEFKPILKDEGINIYHLADVHYRFSDAKNTAGYFGDDIDLYILNGDMGEVETLENYLDVCRFTGEISKGMIPVVFSRGNHDTRGRLAELYIDFFPSERMNTYYTFTIGNLKGIVLDCGEDKPDSHGEYGGANVFEMFRRKETEFLKSLSRDNERLTFAISHICPADNTTQKGSVFDIEGDSYAEWNKQLERLGALFMLSGHVHKAYYLEPDSLVSLRKNPYHVIVGSEKTKDSLIGTALSIYSDRIDVKFTDNNQNINYEFKIMR